MITHQVLLQIREKLLNTRSVMQRLVERKNKTLSSSMVRARRGETDCCCC